jgi:hypothetical protein
MSLTSDDLLKKLKPTKTFGVTKSDVKALAELAISIGPERFVERWSKLTQTKAVKRSNSAQSSELADIKAKTTRFGAKRKLSSAQTAQAIYAYFKSQKKAASLPTRSAEKGVSAMIDWLAKESGVEAVLYLLESFFAKYESDTDLTHRLPSSAG